MTRTPALPEPGSARVEDRVQISRRLIQQARDELERGDRLQAAEKVCGELARMLKAHGQQRGWLNLGNHQSVGHIARQPADEYDNGRILNACVAADNGHRHVHDNGMSPPEVEDIITVVANVLTELEIALSEPPRPFTIRDGDLWRVRTLTGKQDLQVGDTSPTGFSNAH